MPDSTWQACQHADAIIFLTRPERLSRWENQRPRILGADHTAFSALAHLPVPFSFAVRRERVDQPGRIWLPGSLAAADRQVFQYLAARRL
jgi:hypothetical protein